MPEAVALAFSRYASAGHRRSLERLVPACREAGVKAAIATLRRWSVRYGWQRQVKQYDQKRGAEIMASLARANSDALSNHVSRLRTLQDRFVERILIDPEDPRISVAERRRALHPTFRDFRNAVKLERELLGTIARRSR
jgi:hypothetical protein